MTFSHLLRAGLSPIEAKVLLWLVEQLPEGYGVVSRREVARVFGVSESSAKAVLNRIETMGGIERGEIVPDTGRIMRLTLGRLTENDEQTEVVEIHRGAVVHRSVRPSSRDIRRRWIRGAE